MEEKFHQCDEPENMKFKEVNHLSATSKHILFKKRKFCKTLSAKKMILTSAMLLSWKLIIKFSFTIRQQCIAVIVGIGKGQTEQEQEVRSVRCAEHCDNENSDSDQRQSLHQTSSQTKEGSPICTPE